MCLTGLGEEALPLTYLCKEKKNLILKKETSWGQVPPKQRPARGLSDCTIQGGWGQVGRETSDSDKAPKELSCPLMAILRNTTAEKPTLQPGAPVSQGDRKPPPSFASGFSSYKRGVSDVSTGQLTPVCLHGSWACCLEGKRCLRAIPSALPSGTSS